MPAWRGRQAFSVTTWNSASCETRYTDLHARASRYFDFPSMKTAENVDGNIKTRLPSMKRAVFVDGNTKSRLPSMKTAENVDEKFKNRLPSMKRAENVDGCLSLKKVDSLQLK